MKHNIRKYRVRMFENGGAVSSLEDDDIIDPETTMFDPDTGEPMPKKAEPDPAKPDPSKTPDPSKAPVDDPGKNDPPADDPADPEDEPKNHADYVLRSLGYQTSKIDLGEGNIKDVSELTDEEQLEVITARFEELTSFYETKLGEIENNGGSFANPIEKALIDTVRSNEYNLADLAKIIIDNDPASLARNASNEELVRGHLKSMYEDFSDEEIEEELAAMQNTSRFERIASKVREQMMNKPFGEGDLSKALETFKTNSTKKAVQEYQDETKGIMEFIEKTNEFSQIPLSKEVKDFILSDIVSEAPEKNSKFLDSINDPERLFRLSFLDKFHEQLVENTAKHYFELGKAEAAKITSKFKDTPDVISMGKKRIATQSSKAKESEATF
jgi:hypothetical protein